MRRKLISLFAVVIALMLTQSAWAFSDIGEVPHMAKIRELKDAGVVMGEADGTFNPDGKLTYASGITLLVRGLDLSLARFQFPEEPRVSDYFTNAEENAWYANAFVIAQVNGLDIPRDVDPDQTLTREAFAHHLFRAIEATGEYAYILPYILIEDEAEVDPDYMSGIQTLLISNIASLDNDGRFNPKAGITRAEAAEWLYNAREFVRKMQEMPNLLPEPEPSPLKDLALEAEAVNEDVNAVKISAMAPHPGYGIRIALIEFIGSDAVIHIDTVWPDPERMYPQVITEVHAVTYVGAAYNPVLAEDYYGFSTPEKEGTAPVPGSVEIRPAPDFLEDAAEAEQSGSDEEQRESADE